MTDASASNFERPVLFGRPNAPSPIPPPQARPNQRLAGGAGGGQRRRVDSGFDLVSEALLEQVELTTSINASDPQLVLVLEAVEDRTDLVTAAERIGLEVLIEAETAFEPDSEYRLRSGRPGDPFVHSSLHAVCGDQAAFNKLTAAWTTWKRTNSVPGNAPLRDLFSHLKDLRPWGPRDRLQLLETREYLEGLLPDVMHPIEIELWYRASGSRRDAAQSEVQTLVEEAGGSVTASVQIGAIGYHGLKCEVPSDVIQALASGDFEDVRVVKSANVMFLRVSGQSLPPEGDVVASVPRTELHDLPQGNPVVCLLDGIPATNHPLLSGRVTVFDPDEIGDGVSADERRHGTHMSSVAIWGDLASPDVTPAARPVLVRPILVPSAHTANRSEEVREVDLMPDLMRRVFRELFEEDEDGAAVGSEVVVVNLSVGDPATPFDTIISSWARMLDWLSYEYGVLVIVSAGNHTRLPIPMSQAEFSSLQGEERRQAMLDAQESDRVNRRLLSPGESINALTVGAAHADAATASLPPYLADPADGRPAVSPITAFGGGYRRSIKPELLAPGGRAVFTPSVIGSDPIIFRNGGPAGPGIRVADPANAGETHISGTSPAAAAVTRYAAKLVDELERIAPGTLFSRRERALATKALIAHSAVAPGQEYADHTASRATTGNGVLARDLTAGCAENEATLLFLGALPPGHSQELLLPLPDGLSQLGAKRVSATLAWLSPVNWRHRQYRQASLSFSKPGGGIPDLKAGQYRSHAEVTRGATTLQRLDWEVRSSFAVGYGDDLALTVKCFGQAGVQDPGLLEFAVAITLWVDDSLGVDVYSQVAEQITVRTRQAIRP